LKQISLKGNLNEIILFQHQIKSYLHQFNYFWTKLFLHQINQTLHQNQIHFEPILKHNLHQKYWFQLRNQRLGNFNCVYLWTIILEIRTSKKFRQKSVFFEWPLILAHKPDITMHIEDKEIESIFFQLKKWEISHLIRFNFTNLIL